jgi:hypothetical protein
MKETMVTVEETSAKSEAVTVRSLNSPVDDGFFNVCIDDFVHSASMSILMSAMLCLNSAIRYCTSVPDKQYGFFRLFVSSISFNIFATASPVASPVFNDSPLSSFRRSYSNF